MPSISGLRNLLSLVLVALTCFCVLHRAQYEIGGLVINLYMSLKSLYILSLWYSLTNYYFQACFFLVIFLTAPPSGAFYVPGVAPYDFKQGDEVQIKVICLSVFPKFFSQATHESTDVISELDIRHLLFV